MTRPVEVSERIDQWQIAFNWVRQQLTPEKMREILAQMDAVEGVAQLASYMSLARNVMANDRAAAQVAAMLTATGIKPMTLADNEDVGEVS